MPTMNALVFDAPASDTSTSRVAPLDVPEPGPGEVTIDVAHASINFKDVMVRRGDPEYVAAFPIVPGLDAAGTVRALGDGVSGLEVGDRVAAFTNSGGLAEVVLADARVVVPVPDGVGLDSATAAVGVLTTADLLLASARAGETVLVHSASGGVGEAIAQLAPLAQVGTLLGVAGTPERARAAERLGYDAAFVAADDLAATVRAHLGGRGADVVLDPKGTAQLDADLDVLAPGGRLVIFGNAGGAPFGGVPAGRLMGGNVSVGGVSISALAKTAPELLAASIARVLEHLRTGRVTLAPTVVDGLAAAPAAQQELAEGRGTGKRVVRVR